MTAVCKRNHVWADGNEYVTPRGTRACRACRNESERRRQERLLGRSTQLPPESYCVICETTKAISEFREDRRRLSGVRPYCISCAADYNRHRTYGLTKTEYQRLFDAQAGLCAICERSVDTANLVSVDHDHDTGAVRGILCRPCNSRLESMKFSGVRWAKAAAYLADPPASRIIAVAEMEWKIAGGAD